MVDSDSQEPREEEIQKITIEPCHEKNIYRKVPKFWDTRKLCCNHSKTGKGGLTITQCIQKMQTVLQIVKTLIRLLL